MLQGPLPVTAPLVLNPLMAKLAEAAGFLAGYLGGGATGYQKVALEANLNVTEMCLCGLEEGVRGAGRRVRRRREDETGLEPGGKGHVGRHRSREAAGHSARHRRG